MKWIIRLALCGHLSGRNDADNTNIELRSAAIPAAAAAAAAVTTDGPHIIEV